MSQAEEVRARVPMERALERYGFVPSRGGFLRCPFHEGDREPSLKVYRDGWHCFGCGRGGTVIDFVMELFGLAFPQALRRLDWDFALGLGPPGGGGDPRLGRRLERERAMERRRRREYEEAALALCRYRRYLWEVRRSGAPGGPEEEPSPAFTDSLQRLEYLDEVVIPHILENGR